MTKEEILWLKPQRTPDSVSFGNRDFREFICELSVDYFGGKMYTGMAYILYGKKCEQACKRYAEKILPPLQKLLKEELATKTTPTNE
jgi:hypothetical protein